REVGRRLRDEGTAFACEWMWDESIPELVDEAFERNGPHAGPKEMSMVWYHRPDLVRPEQRTAARDNGLVRLEEADSYRFGSRVTYDAVESSPNGTFGDPTDASPEAGEKLFEAAVEQLVGLVEWLGEQPFEDLLPPKPVRERPD
ncbi:creatininase family protein, partial [Halovivax sp.]|uniref:creatininase family protein n=1 Tax=Halovivax sp. TaxID=1935978 RepID=UPI0025C2B6A4